MFSPDKWFTNPSTGFYDHTIDQSLRFEDGDSAKLTRTPSSASNRATWTWSGWIKRGNLGTNQQLFCSTAGDYNLRFNTDDTIIFEGAFGTNTSAAVFRDVAAFYNIVAVHDTTESTSSDRFKLYVNGVQQTTSGAFPSGDGIINNTVEHGIGGQASANFFDGYMAEVNFLDGIANDPTTLGLGEVKDGVWIPKTYSGSHGTNGFYLPFDDSSAIGDDESANTNDFTANNLVASDVVPDSPTNSFCTLNPLDISGTGLTYSEGNLKAERTSSSFAQAYSSFSFDSGKWYAEFLLDTGNSGVGVIAGTTNPGANRYMGQDSYTYGYYSDGRKVNSASYTSYGDSYTKAADGSGDVVGVYIDADNGNIYFSKNGTVQNSGTAAFTGVTGPFRFAIASESNCFHIANFGQDDTFAGLKTSGSAAASDSNGIGKFYDTIGLSDYLAPCTSNLPDPTIGPGQDTQADDHFDILLWTGNGSNAGDQQEINGLSFTPDLVWTKGRSGDGSNPASGQQYHELHDSVRGAGKRVFSNEANAESDVQTLKSFDNDGFTVAMGTGAQSGTNQITTTMVGWSWKAGGTATSNSDGDITSSVSANTDAGFSIISYTGAGSTTTFGHGLGVQPEMLFFKNRDITKSWMVLGKPIQTTYLTLDTTADDQSGYYLSGNTFDSRMTTSLITVDGSTTETNTNGEKYICYAFASIPGFSRVGSYLGNGSSDGVYVNVGFAVKFLIVKTVSSTNRWVMFDNTRSPTNPIEEKHELNPDDNAAEGTSGTDCFDFLSNGFKLRRGGNVFNTSGHTYFYYAVGENPSKFANAR